jgi:putative hemolysin
MLRSIGFIFLAMLVIAPDGALALANPAAVFCRQSGGKTEIRKGHVFCRLPDGRVVICELQPFRRP